MTPPRCAAFLAEWRDGLHGIFASRRRHFFCADSDVDLGNFGTPRAGGVLV